MDKLRAKSSPYIIYTQLMHVYKESKFVFEIQIKISSSIVMQMNFLEINKFT